MDLFDKYVGQVFDGRYKILKIIGIGGMAVVFEAIDFATRRTVAVKMLKEEIANDTASVKRFINESKAVSMLNHPNIVKIYDVSVKESLKYIVMERVDGITLKNYINQKGPLTLKEILNITEQILKALEHAHSKGIIHRDIKPQNIMLLKSGRIKVTDFGIAKLPNAETVTMTDKAIGTVFYISPEQASGKNIDPRSDLYSLGVVMYEMATGVLPFTAESPVSVALMQVSATPKPIRDRMPSIPIGLEQVIMGAMEKKPERRFQSATQMLKHITQLKNNPAHVFKVRRTNEKNAAAQPQSERRRRRSTSMLPVIAGVTAAFMIVIGLSAAFIMTKFFEANSSDSKKRIIIPSFIGQTYTEQMKTDLEETYYRVSVRYIYDAESEENTIIEQTPEAGLARKVILGKQYCDIVFKISRGAKTIMFNDYTVMEYRSVVEQLKTKGIIANVVNKEDDYIENGFIISTDPVAGTILNDGDTVTLYVSIGKKVEYVLVPNFIGLDEVKAMSTLVEFELALGNVNYEYSDKPAGQIIRQSRTANIEVPKNVTEIGFTVSLGPAPVEKSGT